jgi:hypothetical protein
MLQRTIMYGEVFMAVVAKTREEAIKKANRHDPPDDGFPGREWRVCDEGTTNSWVSGRCQE